MYTYIYIYDYICVYIHIYIYIYIEFDTSLDRSVARSLDRSVTFRSELWNYTRNQNSFTIIRYVMYVMYVMYVNTQLFFVIFLLKIDQKLYQEQPQTAPGTDRISNYV